MAIVCYFEFDAELGTFAVKSLGKVILKDTFSQHAALSLKCTKISVNNALH